MGQCPDRTPGPLTIAHGQARYTTATGRQLEATVGSQGEFAMRLADPNVSEMQVSGTIDGTGTVRARQRGNSCSYDFVWQRQSS